MTKNKIYSTIFMLLFSLCVCAQTNKDIAVIESKETKEAVKPADPNAPEITFENEVHDFGTIEYGGNAVYNFKFTNTGKSPLIISGAKGSCGCTVPKWSKEPIIKGATGEINVSYDTKRTGPFTKTVTVTSNAKTDSKLITIKGTVMTQEETESLTPFNRTDKSGTPFESPVKNN